MAQLAKFLSSTAGVASGSGGGLDVDNVFSTTLYDGTGSAQTITNNIDLSSEGGLVWTKVRSNGFSNALIDTERGVNNFLKSNATNTQDTGHTDTITSFNSNGYNLGSDSSEWFWNRSGEDYVSWTFRNSPMFQVVTYTGNGVAGRTVAHNLNGPVGMILLKRTDASSGWRVYHRGANGGTNPEQYYAMLQSNNAFAAASTVWNNTAPTSTEFTLGTDTDSNVNGGTYVAYIFAHHANDGSATGFGSDGASPVISCGSFVGNGSNTGPIINLGFEPQWLMIKGATIAKEWRIHDVMRGMPVGGSGAFIEANSSNAEGTDNGPVALLPNGFQLTQGGSETNNNNDTYIYMAIRRPMAIPTSPSQAFDVTLINGDGTNYRKITTSNVSDLTFGKGRYSDNYDWGVQTRLTGASSYLKLHETGSEGSNGNSRIAAFDHNDGYEVSGSFFNQSGKSNILYNFTRAPGVFDHVCYTGTGSATTITHSLNATPEMMILRARSGEGRWVIYHKGLNGGTNPEQYYAKLPDTSVSQTSTIFNDTAPTSSVFSVGSHVWTNSSSVTYYALLFGTVAGISKVGFFSHTYGSDTNVDCGFSSGARFIFIRKADSNRNTVIFDTENGIVSGNDPYLQPNTSEARVTNLDLVDQLSSGFTLTSENDSGNWIFLAMA